MAERGKKRGANERDEGSSYQSGRSGLDNLGQMIRDQMRTDVAEQLEGFKTDITSNQVTKEQFTALQKQVTAVQNQVQDMHRDNLRSINGRMRNNDEIVWLPPAPQFPFCQNATKWDVYEILTGPQITALLTHYALNNQGEIGPTKKRLIDFLGLD